MEFVIEGPTLVLSGSFDVRSTSAVREALYDLIAHHDGDLWVDLTAVDAIDTTALRVLVVATRTVERQGRHLQLRGCRPPVRRMLHLARLRHLVAVEPGQLAV